MVNHVLEIEGLTVDLAPRQARRAPVRAIDNVSLHVNAGEVVALVGESGSGKSMTARSVLGLLPPNAQTSGCIRLCGHDLLGATEQELNDVRGQRVGLVFQEPQSALNPVRTVGWQIQEALNAHGDWSKGSAHSKAVEMLSQVEIPDPAARMHSYPHQLSGGQKQRVAIALALTHDPDLLIADEPTTALDVTVQAEILSLLSRVRRHSGTGVLLITHNMGVVAQMADRVVVMRQGEVVEAADCRSIFARPAHDYTRQLLAAVPRSPLNGGAHAVTPVSPRDDAEIVRFDDITVTYPGRGRSLAHRAADGVSLSVHTGEVLALVGESGSGKTTLGRVAAGLTPISSGRVQVLGVDPQSADRRARRDLRRQLALVHQDPAGSLDPKMTVAECIREPLDIHRLGPGRERSGRVKEMLEAVRLPSSFSRRRPHELSGGQRQRVSLARALVLQPQLLIADEPTSALDVSVQAEVLDLLEDLQATWQFACLFITHDLTVVSRIAHRVAVLRDGRVQELGSTRHVFEQPDNPYTRQLLQAIPIPDPARRNLATPNDSPHIAVATDGHAQLSLSSTEGAFQGRA